MDRRKFFFSAASVAIAGALPATVTAALAQRPAGASLPWASLAACLADCGACYRVRGPIEGSLILEGAVSASSTNRERQFIATFGGPNDAPEGLYEIASDRGRTLLFLQPVQGSPGKLQAVFSLI